MKRFAIAFAVLLALAAHALAAGTISFSLSQQLDANAKPLANCSLYFIQAGTTATPQNAFKDAALTLPHPNPMRCDAAGRLEQFYLADGQIKIRLTDKNGLQILQADNLLVIGPSSGGGGGGGSVDPTTIIATGDIKAKYGTGSLAGFVRMNGRTIGNASSGATERANADTQALFEYLCSNDNNLVMTPPRSGNCSTDFAAGKSMTLPDFRGRGLAALADMGSSDNGLFTGATFTSGNATTLGSLIGAARRSLALANIPSHDHDVFTFEMGHSHTAPLQGGFTSFQGGGNPFYTGGGPGTTGTAMSGVQVRSAAAGAGTENKTAATGSGTTFDTMTPAALVTFYVKL